MSKEQLKIESDKVVGIGPPTVREILLKHIAVAKLCADNENYIAIQFSIKEAEDLLALLDEPKGRDVTRFRCQACGDAERCDFYCVLEMPYFLKPPENMLCPVSGDETGWEEFKPADKPKCETCEDRKVVTGLGDILGEKLPEFPKPLPATKPCPDCQDEYLIRKLEEGFK